MPALRSLPIFCFTEHAEIIVYEKKFEMQVEIWRFVILKPNFSMTIFLDPSLGDFPPPLKVNLKQHLSKNITNKIIREDITLLKI